MTGRHDMIRKAIAHRSSRISPVESYLAKELRRWRRGDTDQRQEIAERAARFLGLAPMAATLVDVPESLGGGWLVSMAGVCRGPDGFVAHIDRQGWILRVAMEPNWRVPGHKTPIAEVMELLIDDPIRPGLGLLPLEIDDAEAEIEAENDALIAKSDAEHDAEIAALLSEF